MKRVPPCALQGTGRLRPSRVLGFTLTEMLVSMAIFLVICGSAFTLLGMSQQRYQAESQKLNSFQEARLGLDQIMRDVSSAGYPPPNQFTVTPPNSDPQVAASPFAWSPGYLSNTPCYIGGAGNPPCVTPWDDGFFIETNPTPEVNASPVDYIRYKMLNNNTLGRGVFPKNGGDPYATIPDSLLTPFVHNVMNEAAPGVIAQINAVYPNMFPGGIAVPVFTYLCDTPNKGPQVCTSPGTYGVPSNIRSVLVTLIVEAPPDPQTGQVRVIELTGEASRINSFP
ncbi:MAG: prepilin-type N-terminal cleavage/methylation domain-containing protein [Candidatus Acidiferrum sp.]|jgi:prepilin-type N-terminal cleavage/methylation domain-containing protein